MTAELVTAGYQPEEMDAFPLTVVSMIRNSRTLQAHTCRRRMCNRMVRRLSRNVSFDLVRKAGMGAKRDFSDGHRPAWSILNWTPFNAFLLFAFLVKSITNKSSMADPSLISSVTEMNDQFLEDITCPYELYIPDSRMSGAGFGLFVREEVPAVKEVFRVAVPAISAACVFCLIGDCMHSI